MPISLMLILGLLYSLFNNLRDCLLALAGIPDAVVGGILALYVSGLNFSISAAIGFVSLFGVSVMDGILMITFYNQERAHGLDASGRDVSCRHHPDAPPADDGSFGLHWPVPCGDLHGYRQPGAASAGDGHRGRHAGRPRHAAPRCAGAENDVSWRRESPQQQRNRNEAACLTLADDQLCRIHS